MTMITMEAEEGSHLHTITLFDKCNEGLVDLMYVSRPL